MNGHSYPEVAAHAIARAYHQNPSPVYGYLRSGYQQKIYLFQTIEDGRGWFSVLGGGQQPFDYAAVFSATDLSRPVPGLESYGQANVSGDPYVGNWLPFLLGLPLGGLAGYYLREWQEGHPGQSVPGVPPGKLPAPNVPGAPPPPSPSSPKAPSKTSGDPYGYSVGAPWLDMVGPSVGGPWVDMVGPASVGGPWVDMVGPASVGGPWVDMVGPASVGGPWVDMVGPASVGGPWVDMVGPTVGGPWVDMIGPASVGVSYGSSPYEQRLHPDIARRRNWPQVQALIQSAIDEITGYAGNYPADYYVWTLDAPGPSGRPGVMLEPTTLVAPFSSRVEALNYLRQVAQTGPVASALFDRTGSHWPNPVAWHKSDNPEHEPLIAQHIASHGTTRMSGVIRGRRGGYGTTTIGAAIDDVRRRAQTLAEKRAGSVIGVIHTSKDGLWHTLAFRTSDDADDWLGTATHDPALYTYAAYYDKDDYSWPHAVNEKIGGARAVSSPGSIGTRDVATTSGDAYIGAVLDDYRKHARQLATVRPGGAAGVIRTSEGLWHALGFRTLDDAVDWLQAATREKASFLYAAIFEKASDGSAYFQDEEVGEPRSQSVAQPTIHRGIATASGHYDYGWAA